MRVLFALLALAATVSAQTVTGPNFYIVGNNATLGYLFAINGANVEDPSFDLTVGNTYKFFLNVSLPAHPLGFSLDNDATTITLGNSTQLAQAGVTASASCQTSNGGWRTDDVANPCIITVVPPVANQGSTLYYRCANHAAMIGALNAVASGTTATTTTAPPTNPGTTTAPPTNPGTTTAPPTSTGNNSATNIVPGAIAAIIAAINTFFA